MALIKCPDCGNEVSDKAKACIHCGYPIEDMQPQKVEMYEEARKKLYSELSKRMNIPLSYIANIKEVLHIIDSSRVSKEDIVGYYDDPRFNGASLLNTLKSISLEEIPAENIIDFFEGDNVSWKADFSRIVYIGEDQYDDEAIDYEEKERMDLLINSKIEMYKKKMMLNRTSASFTSTLTPSSKGISATTGAIIGGALAGTTGAIIGGLSAYEQRMKSQELLNRHNAILSKYNSEFSNFNQAIVELEQLKKVMPTREIRVKRVLYGLKTNIGLIPFVVRKYEIPGLKDEFVKDYLKDVNMYDIYYQRKLINKDSLANAVKCNNISEIKSINGDAIGVIEPVDAINISSSLEGNNNDEQNECINKLVKARKIAEIIEGRVLVLDHLTIALADNGHIYTTKVLNDELGIYDRGRSTVANWENIVEISGWNNAIYGIHENGCIDTIVADQRFAFPQNINNVRHIYGDVRVYAILNDGTVKAKCNYSEYSPNCGQSDVESMSDIDSLMYTGNVVIFKKKDGSLVSTKYKRPITIKPEEEVYAFEPWDDAICEWKDIDKIVYFGTRFVGIKSDGTLVASEYKRPPKGIIDKDSWPDISQWTDIVDLIMINDDYIGLTKYGTLVASDEFINNNRKLWYEINSWKGVIKLVNLFLDGILIALLSTGEVVNTRYSNKQPESLEDIPRIIDAIGLKATYEGVAVIKKDGTLNVYGGNEHGKCNVNHFRLFDNLDDLLAKVRQRELGYEYENYVSMRNSEIEETLYPLKISICNKYKEQRDQVEKEIKHIFEDEKEKQAKLIDKKDELVAEMKALGLFKVAEKKSIAQKIQEIDVEIEKLANEERIRDSFKNRLEEINRQENQEIEQKRNELISQHSILTFQEYIDEKNGVIKA